MDHATSVSHHLEWDLALWLIDVWRPAQAYNRIHIYMMRPCICMYSEGRPMSAYSYSRRRDTSTWLALLEAGIHVLDCHYTYLLFMFVLFLIFFKIFFNTLSTYPLANSRQNSFLACLCHFDGYFLTRARREENKIIIGFASRIRIALFLLAVAYTFRMTSRRCLDIEESHFYVTSRTDVALCFKMHLAERGFQS